jgi:integrase
MLAEHNVRKGFFERAQFEAVRDRLPATYQAIVTLAYYTGWRINSEILPLERHQVDRQAGVIRLEPGTTKNRDGRLFLYAGIDEVKAAVDGLWARHEALERQGIITPLVFCRRKGQRIRTFWKRWKTATTLAGCPGRIPHDFRRTAVRNLNRAGVPETIAMKITGHKRGACSTVTTSRAKRISPRRRASFNSSRGQFQGQRPLLTRKRCGNVSLTL